MHKQDSDVVKILRFFIALKSGFEEASSCKLR
ncbi:MAG: hypothetical protein ACD_15C00191G0004 [uncultured bacterium]|nr:MAG: hypothetical protein ACD_15C00191G0004 [uncultured bacterium]